MKKTKRSEERVNDFFGIYLIGAKKEMVFENDIPPKDDTKGIEIVGHIEGTKKFKDSKTLAGQILDYAKCNLGDKFKHFYVIVGQGNDAQIMHRGSK